MHWMVVKMMYCRKIRKKWIRRMMKKTVGVM